MANYNQSKVTQSVFDAVKICLASGNSVSETAKFMKLGWETVQFIRDAETLDGYKSAMYERSRKYKKEAKQEEPTKQYVNPTVIKVEATHYMMQELQKTNELLTLISAKLATIVSDLYGVKP